MACLFTLENRFEADTGSTTNNGSLFWCRANDAPATAPTVCPGVAFVTTPPPCKCRRPHSPPSSAV